MNNSQGQPNMFQMLIQQALQRNPQLSQSPQAQAIVNALMNGDKEAGEKLAQNYCETYGVNPQQGVQQAQNFFKQMFTGGRPF